MPIFDWNQIISHLPDQWRVTRGNGVKIALFDSGINLNHPGISIPEGRRFNASDPEFDPNQPEKYSDGDIQGPPQNQAHGTSMSSMLIGQPLGNAGISGIVPEADLHFFRVVNNNKSLELIYFLNALQAAIRLDMDIICMPYYPSLGRQPHQQLFTQLLKEETLLFCSTKNADDPAVMNDVPFPANHPYSIAVSSLNDTILTSAIEQQYQFKGIDFALPQVKVNVYISGPENITVLPSQSSHATVTLAGIAALCYSFYRHTGQLPRRNRQKVLDALRQIAAPYSPEEMRDTSVIRFFKF